MRPSYQSSTALKFVKLRHQRGKLIRTATIQIFIENAQEIYIMVVGKVTEAEMPVQDQ